MKLPQLFYVIASSLYQTALSYSVDSDCHDIKTPASKDMEEVHVLRNADNLLHTTEHDALKSRNDHSVFVLTSLGRWFKYPLRQEWVFTFSKLPLAPNLRVVYACFQFKLNVADFYMRDMSWQTF
jgi:hypothetical protein